MGSEQVPLPGRARAAEPARTCRCPVGSDRSGAVVLT